MFVNGGNQEYGAGATGATHFARSRIHHRKFLSKLQAHGIDPAWFTAYLSGSVCHGPTGRAWAWAGLGRDMAKCHGLGPQMNGPGRAWAWLPVMGFTAESPTDHHVRTDRPDGGQQTALCRPLGYKRRKQTLPRILNLKWVLTIVRCLERGRIARVCRSTAASGRSVQPNYNYFNVSM